MKFKAMKRVLPVVALLFSQQLFFAQTISFLDRTSGSGLGGELLNQGIAISDCDGDGREDIYVTASGGGPNRLYRALDHFKYEDIAEVAGVHYTGNSRVSTWGDIDNDGDPDLYVGNRDEPDLLFINQGGCAFIEASADRGIDNPGNTTSVAMADVNNDGSLDIYVSNIQSRNQLYINDGQGHFVNEAQARGVDDLAVGMGAVFFDYDLDGDIDLYQCHDAQIPYILYENQGNGTFTNISEQAKVNYAGFGMGVDVGDFNRDGFMDMYITNLFANVLYQNLGDGTFDNVNEEYGVDDFGMGWGNVFADFDNDGYQDIYVSNDYKFSPIDNALFRNTGTGFEDVSEGDPCNNPFGGYAAAATDLNEDGKVDLVIANSGAPGVRILQNVSTTGHNYFALQLEGDDSNRDAVGARVEVYTASGTQYDQVVGNSGFGTHNGKWLHFGLGEDDQIDSVIVHWPSGAVSNITQGIPIDQRVRWTESQIISATDPVVHEKHRCSIIQSGDRWVLDHGNATDRLSEITIYNDLGQRIPIINSATGPGVRFQLVNQVMGIYTVHVQQDDRICATRFFHSQQ